MTLQQVEFLPPGATAETAQKAVFRGEGSDLELLASGIYALEGQQKQSFAAGSSFALTKEQLNEARREWHSATPYRVGRSLEKIVPIATGVIAARGALLLHGLSIVQRNLSGEAGTTPTSGRQSRLHTIADRLAPFQKIIEAQNQQAR